MSERAKAAAAPAPEQRAAIADRRRDLFLAAGAGTGKTSVLVERFCEAVAARGGEDAAVGVESILAFTFTDRAAGELKRRIRAGLAERGEQAAMAGDAVRARELRSLARESEAAWISTIHSFCQRVLAANPLAAGLDPGFSVLDEPAAGRLASQAFDAAFRRFSERGGDERFELAAAYRVPALGRLVRSAHDELRARGSERPALPTLAPPDARAAVADLHRAAAAALAATAQAAGKAKVDDCRARIAAALAGTDGRTPTEEEVAGWRFNKLKALACPEVERYQEAAQRLERRLVEAAFAERYEHLAELVSLYAEEYGRRKQERSALDFEDLELCARRLLRDSDDVRRRYQRQFHHLMVDELQDTNAVQAALVRLLHEEDGEPRNRLFVVGDELQSIYAFRHADVEVFRRLREAFAAAPDERAGVRRLTGNFRSHPDVLALVNRGGERLFGPAYEELAAGSVPEVSAPDGAVEVLVTERERWDERAVPLDVSPDEQAQPWRVAEARFLAGRLAELRDAGTPPGEMAVILRSFSYVEAYEQALEEAGLRPYVVGGRGYWSKQQVADVRNLLACVANPLDEKALFGVLSSPACGVSPDSLWLLRQAGRPWPAMQFLFGAEAERGGEREDAGEEEPPERVSAWRERVTELGGHIPEEDAEALRELCAILPAVRAEAPRLSLEALVDRVVTATGYDLALLMRPRGRRRMANVRKLMRLAREFEAAEGRDLRGFLDFVAGETEVAGREAEAAVDAEGHDGVRVMTAHAAKGLEFPVVAVADLGRGLAAGSPPALRLEPANDDEDGGDADPSTGAMRVGLRLARLGRKGTAIFDYPELEERAVAREREEERRILHVSMTRAERRLILSGAMALRKLHEEPKDTEPLIGPVLRAIGWTEDQEAVELPPPPLRPGLDAALAPARVAVKVRCPEDDAQEVGAAETPAAVGSPAAADAEDGAAVTAQGDGHARAVPDDDLRPLDDPDLAPLPTAAGAAVRAVSYSALSLYERCGYRFYAERVLGMRPRLARAGAGGDGASAAAEAYGDDEAPESELLADGADEWHPADDAENLTHRYARGRVVHELLERSARSGWSRPDPQEVAALLRREGVAGGAGEVSRAAALVDGFLASSLHDRVRVAATVLAEAPFAFRSGGLVVRGEIDLLADLGDEILVVDYKTDALAGEAPAAHLARYEVQRRIYALAALRRYGRPVCVAYVFLERPDEPVEMRFAVEDGQRLGAELASLTAGVERGRFEVTGTPERALCHDCPARDRLCSHPRALTMRDAA